MSFLKQIYSKKSIPGGYEKYRILGIKFKKRAKNYMPPVKNPKLGVSYSVWDGEELLESAIRSIRPAVEYVNVVWQKYSWHGNECAPDLEEKLLTLKEKGLIDELIFFDCDPKINPNVNECTKRNLGLEAARRAGCTHFMTLDTDEYFDLERFKQAKQFVYDQNLTHTACVQYGYRTATLRYTQALDFFPPFIYRIDHEECFKLGCFKDSLPWLLDPTKQIPIKKNSRICFLHNIEMHHYSFVRKNYHKKLLNSAANQRENWVEDYECKMHLENEFQSLIDSGICVKVPNYFNIHVVGEKND